MDDKEIFRMWLTDNTNLSVYSIKRYSDAIPLLNEKHKKNFFNTEELDEIENLLINPDFIIFNKSQGNMYSAALGHLKKFLKLENLIEDFKKEIFFEKIRYEKKSNSNSEINLNQKDYREPLPDYVALSGMKIWKRNPLYAKKSLFSSEYLCEVDKNHEYFKSNKTGQNYLEAHHLIPIKYQNSFLWSIDIPANIVAVCVNCHKILHHGVIEDKKKILNKIYNERKYRLAVCGIDISFKKLLNYY